MPFKREVQIYWPEASLTVKNELPKGYSIGDGWIYDLNKQDRVVLTLAESSKYMHGNFEIYNGKSSVITTDQRCELVDIQDLSIKLRKVAASVDPSKVVRPRYDPGGIKSIIKKHGLEGVPDFVARQFDDRFARNFDPDEFDRLLQKVDNAVSTKDKGDSYEELTADLLSRCEGVFELVDRNIDDGANKIDILLRVIDEPFFGPPRSPIVVECKNRDEKTGLSTIQQIISYMDSKKANWGIVFAIHDETSYTHEHRRETFLQHGRVIVVITREDLVEIGEKQNLLSILKRKYDELYLNTPPAK